jgi:hypothetical protein
MAEIAPAPACELFAGKAHDDNPPAAVARVQLSWIIWAADGATRQETKWHEVNLCRECYDVKAREFVPKGDSLLIVERYAGGSRLDNHVGGWPIQRHSVYYPRTR